jgi:thiol-disulfide isomerase/thioredoxin
VVLLEFWASWCRPCLDLVPWLAALAHEWAPRGLQVVSVNCERDRPSEEIARIARRHAAPYPVVHDRRGDLCRAYEVASFPRLVLVDRGGVIKAVHIRNNPRVLASLRARIVAEIAAGSSVAQAGRGIE